VAFRSDRTCYSSVLGKDRTPLGYLDVSKLVASNPNPVGHFPPLPTKCNGCADRVPLGRSSVESYHEVSAS